MSDKQVWFDGLSHEELCSAIQAAGGQRAFAKQHGLVRTTVQYRMNKAQRKNKPEVLMEFGHRPPPAPRELCESWDFSTVQRFILTSAQDATRVHEPFLKNLEAYRDYLRGIGTCDLLISGFTYNKSLFEDHGKHKVYWADSITPYMANERMSIDGQIDFCGEMNILPTATDPLSGLESYTQNRWGVFPHAKVALKSIPTMKNDPAKLIMTTGTVTLPNYVPKKAGLKASFHHVLGAVLVEVGIDGSFFCRHLIGDEIDGSFYDLDRHIACGEVTNGHRIRSLTPGDIHVAQIDQEVSAATFGFSPTNLKHRDGGRVWQKAAAPPLLDTLKPEYLFVHDVADFRSRNHHNIADPHDRFRLHIKGAESVEAEMAEVAFFLESVRRDEMQVVVVESNHDLALNKWLKTGDYRMDPVNASFFLQCQLASYLAMEHDEDRFSIFEYVMTEVFDCEGIRFLRQDESFLVDDVENANHGHNGPNGARGNIRQFAKIGPKVTVGHSHSCGIFDGANQTGTSSKNDMGYNVGPSSWSPTHNVQYANGKRTLITMNQGKFFL